LDLDENHPGNFARAGAFFLQHGEMGEAERCYARSFRLDRTRSDVALRLADIYNESDRARDGLAVLDLCLREGCQDPAVYWQAGLIAFEQESYDWVLTYYTRLEEVWPDKPWVPYYLAWALIETNQHDEALRALESESLRNTECRFHVDALRASVYGAAGKNDPERFRKELQKVLDHRLVEVDSLSHRDLSRLFHKLTLASASLPSDDETRKAFQLLSLQTGLAAETLFEPHRDHEHPEDGIKYYVVLIRQPLDDHWPEHPGCLSGQESWSAYVCPWGVLARDEDEAEQWVRKWQSQCYPLQMEVLDIQLQNEGYRDSPGIVWQGSHQPPFLAMNGQGDDDDFEDDFDDEDDDLDELE
jgi:tetratricopeptide (TPR) repeat protein